MELGKKIRLVRLEKHMKQSDVASDKITRNMLSAIENGKATPSLDTLVYIAEKLELPIHYLLSDSIDAAEYRKSELMPIIKKAYKNRNYTECIDLLEDLGVVDDETAFILTSSHFELGVAAAKNGAFITADRHLILADEYSSKTIYDTASIRYRIPLYLSFVRNVNAPLLDFDKDAFMDKMLTCSDYEFFKYVCNDWEYPYSNPLFKKHAEAKCRIKERKYYEAIKILSEIAEAKSDFEYNAYLMYGVYADLDNCYKQVLDFENAYKYVTKKISMLEGFTS